MRAHLRVWVAGLALVACRKPGETVEKAEPEGEAGERSAEVSASSDREDGPTPKVLATFRLGEEAGFIGLDGERAFGGRTWPLVYPFSSGVACVNAGGQAAQVGGRWMVQGGTWRLLDGRGEVRGDYPHAVHAREHRVHYTVADGARLEDLTGELLAAKMEQIGTPQNGRVVAVDGSGATIGWLDTKTGDWAASVPREDHRVVCPYHEELACLAFEKGGCGYVDLDGEPAFAERFELCGNFRDGVAPASDDGEAWGLIDKTGARVLADRWQDMWSAGEDRLFVAEDGRWGLIDTAGEIVVEPRFRSFRPFSEGLAAVVVEGELRTSYIDPSGELALKVEHPVALDFHFDRAIYFAEDGKVGYIDKRGEIVIPARFDLLGDFVAVAADNPQDPYGLNTAPQLFGAVLEQALSGP